jgi:hypothetical protein
MTGSATSAAAAIKAIFIKISSFHEPPAGHLAKSDPGPGSAAILTDPIEPTPPVQPRPSFVPVGCGMAATAGDSRYENMPHMAIGDRPCGARRAAHIAAAGFLSAGYPADRTSSIMTCKPNQV